MNTASAIRESLTRVWQTFALRLVTAVPRLAYCALVGGLRCVDGSSLAVIPVASHDRGGTPFEVTLELQRNGESFGSVGERCGFFLADLARRVNAAREADCRHWPDADDRFPEPPLALAVNGTELAGHLPREPELFAFRYRDRGDLISTGELRCTLRTSSTWVASQSGSAHGYWRVARRAVVEAWGAGGRGVRAVLTSGELARFLSDVLDQAARAGASYRDLTTGPLMGRSGR
jgi:hypothetical protein